jgi:hypothetical protein
VTVRHLNRLRCEWQRLQRAVNVHATTTPRQRARQQRRLEELRRLPQIIDAAQGAAR